MTWLKNNAFKPIIFWNESPSPFLEPHERKTDAQPHTLTKVQNDTLTNMYR